MATILIDGVKYIVSDDPNAERRLRFDIDNNINGRGDQHERKKRELGFRPYEDERSSFYEGFVSGLTNSPENAQYYLGSRRFPEDLQRNRNPNERYYIDPESDDLMFIDLEGVYGPKGQAYKEFENVTSWGDLDADDFTSWLGPGAQLILEMTLGGAGMAGGAFLGTAVKPGAGTVTGGLALGSLGSAAGTALGQGLRSGVSAVLGGPEADIDQLISDTKWSAGFGLLPIGLPKGSVKQAFRQLKDATLPRIGYLRNKFPDEQGQDIITAILKEGGGDVDETIARAAEYGIQLTRGEAARGIGEAAFAQYYLGQGSRAYLMTEMYLDRANHVADMVTRFTEDLTKGKYVPASMRNPLTGKLKAFSESLAELDVARAADDFIKAEQKRRSARAGELYKQAYELDAGGSPELAALVDVFLTGKEIPNTSFNEKPLQGFLNILKDPDLDPTRRQAYTALATSLTSKKQLQAALEKMKDLPEDAPRPKYFPVNTSEEVANTLQRTFDTLITRYQKSDTVNDKMLANELSQLKAAMTEAFGAYNPLWARAQDIYRPEDAMSTLKDVKIINDIAKIAEAGGTEATRAVSRLFSGSAEPIDILKLKTAVQETNPMAWQRLKGDWLRTMFRDVQQKTQGELGVPNKFLAALQLRGDVADLTRAADADDLSRQVAVYRAMFEPQELEELARISDILQMVASVQTRTNSDTMSKAAFRERLDIESQKAGVNIPETVFNALGILGRSTRQIRDTVTGSIAARIKQERIDAYEDVLIDQILNPNADRAFLEMMEKAFPVYYAALTSGLREGTQAIGEGQQISPEGQIRRKTEQNLQQQQEEEEEAAADQNLQGQIDTMSIPQLDGDIFEPLPQTGSGAPQLSMLGPTILPSDEDRELAERLRMTRSGIGGLAV
jgi:hypothetical protein